MNIALARSCEQLTEEFRAKQLNLTGEKLVFAGVGNNDVYNIAAPFIDEDEAVIAGRVEARDSEYSTVQFFVERNGCWEPRSGSRVFSNLQDPFFTRIQDELIFGGVEVWSNPHKPGTIDYRTAFYRGQSIADLRLFAVGPQWMKDIRLVELSDGRIGVFTRPNGEYWGGQAQVGWAVINQLDELKPDVIASAQTIPGLFVDGEWGGVNEPHLLSDGKIGALGHISYHSADDHLHYRPMIFTFDPSSLEVSPVQVIAERSSFPSGEAKRPNLVDVVFSGGLIRHGDGTAELYTGISDVEAHRLRLPDPFAL